jgi:hypothetical protein
MNTNRASRVLLLTELNNFIQETNEIIKILYARLDYYIAKGNDIEINITKIYLLEYENKLSDYKAKVKLLND